MATRKKTAARPILSLDDLDAAGIGLGWQPMVPAQEVAPVAPVEQEQDGPMARGVKQVSASVGLAGRLAARDFDGAAQNISDQAAYRAANPGSEEAQGLRSAWQQGDGIWGGIKAVAGEFADDYKRADGVGAGVMSVGRNLQAMGSSLVEQVPNMALPMAGMIGGGAAGSAAAGPIGTVAGGWAGASAGNALVGTSEAAFRQLEKAGVNPTDAAAVREYLANNGDAILGETAIKGGVIGAVDVATAGLAHWLLSGPGKMATTKALTEMGVDMADKAAVKAATKTPVFKNLIANDATYQATQVGAQKLLRNTGAAATEPVGEFAGEYGGSLAATGEADAKDAFLEAASSLGQSGIMFAGQKAIQAIKSPSQAAADTIRATEKVPESGALTKAVNAGVEAKAKAVEAGGLELAPLVDGAAPEAVTSNGLALVPRPGEQTPEPVDDPVRDQILALPDGARQDALRAYAVVNRTDVANGVQQYNRKLLDRLLAENKPEPEPAPEIGGVIRNFDPASPPVSPLSLAPMGGNVYDNGIDFQSDSQAELASRSAELDRLTQRAPRTRTDGVDLDLQADPVLNYLDSLRSVNTPAARAYVRDFDAGRITPADVQQRMQAEQRIARAAAEAPAQVDTVAERLRSAAAQGMATPAPTDILNPAGEPFKTKMAADLAAKKSPGAAVLPVVDGGFLVRPQEPVNVQDVPQAPEVPKAAPAISQPGQAPQAVGAQPAGPAAGVPTEGAGAVEAAGVADGPGSDAGNGFKRGPQEGERYRVGVSSATGGVTIEKRLPAGTVATFYVGKDGGLIDADDVNLVGTKDREKLWIPTTPEQASQATAILDEMGRLDLTDPKRKDAKARLKALVTATAAVEAAGVGGANSGVAAPAPQTGPIRLGRNNTPLSEGGKPFKTRKAAGDAKKLQPTMRVVTVPGGYALAEKTPAQLAAEERASRRLRNPNTSARGEPIPAHAFIAAAGGLNRAAASDMGVDGNPRIGNRTLFAGKGRGLSMDQATQMLIQDGYLSEGATINDALALIKKSLTQPQYNADGIERIAQAEADAQFEDYLAAQEDAAADDDEFDPFGPAPTALDEFSDDMLESSGYDAATDAIKAEVRALLEMANAQGIDTESIMLDAHERTRNATEQDYYEAAKSALEAAIARSRGDSGALAGGQGQRAGAAEGAQELGQPEALELESQTPAEAAAQVAQPQGTAEQAIRDAFQALPSVSLGEFYPITVQHNGREQQFLASERALKRSNQPHAALTLLQIRRGRMIAGDNLQDIAYTYKLSGKNELTEVSVRPASDELIQRWRDAFAPTAESQPVTPLLTAQTPEEIVARQEAAEAAKREQEVADRKEREQERQDEERKRIAQASVRAADTFELGQDPLDSLTGQGSIFDAQEPEQQAHKATETVAEQPEATKLTPAEAKSLMAWEDLGQKDGVKTHALTFYESQADKDAKRGRMIVAKVSKGDRSATAWMVDGEDKTFGALAQAKKLAEEVGMAKAVADGFVEQGAPAPANDRNAFTLQRLNRETGQMEPVTFERGEYVRYAVGGKDQFGDIDGISQARKEFSVDGLWYPFGFAYKAERPAAPKADTVPLSSVIDKVNAKNGQGLTDADRVPEQKPASKTPTVDRHNATMAAVREGKATPEQFQSSFEQVVSNKDAIVAELDTMTKVQLLREGGPFVQMRYANEKKAEVVDAVYRQMVGEYALGESVAYSMGKGAYEAAVRKMVEATDADKLANYVAERKAAMEEMQSRRAAKAAALENPQTLADFREVLNAKIREGMTRKEAFLTLTPQQRIQYDTLEAESTREARENRKRAQKTEVRAAGQTTAGEIVATKHTRDGYDLFVVKLADRLSKEDYSTVLASAKKLGGWYSAFRGNGAIPGFQFKDKANAEAFLALAGGDTTAAQEQVAQRRDAFEDDRSQTAVERLRAMAEKLEEGAAEVEGQQRKTNTARRARFASAAMASAAADKAKAQTMRNIARAIEDGEAKFLDAVRTKSQVDMLTGIVDTAKGNELRAKYPSYADQEKRKGEPPTAETADFAEFPSYSAFRSDLATLGRQMLEVDGTKKLGQRLMSVADDVTDAYLEFAKANIQQVSQFGRGDALAEFASKDEAERAIKRSGLTGKAIVLPIKRGQNRVILSPSEAIGRGLWQGDGDKRITLTAEFGAELVEAIGRRGNKQNKLSVPWQFQNAYDRRKALSRIGIETPSEFRAALREFISLKEQAIANRTRELELQMVGRKADGLDFFPTSAEVADQMIEAADLTPDMAVLEPSAGMGHLADRIREAGAEPDVIEISTDRRALLEEKGYTTQAVDDFLDLKPREFYTFGDTFRAPDGAEGIMRGANGNRVKLVNQAGDMVGTGYYDRADLTGVAHNGTASGYDRIIMNPPFSNRRDAEHVRHAYSLLKPGGRIVAIMGEGVFFGQDKKAQDFREWLESVGGTSEKLPEGSFMDPSLPVNTSVNARMVVIDKPATEGGNVAMFRSIRTAKSTQTKLSQDAVEKAVASALNRVVGAPKVQVVAAPADAGIDVPPGVIPKGVTLPDGSVLIFSDSAESVLDVFQTVFHELYHRGSKVRFTSNPDYITKMLEIASKDELVQQEVNAWKNTADGKDKWAEFQERGPMTGERLANFEALAVEEALATMAEKVAMGEVRKPETVIKQIARFIAKVANAWGMNRFALWLNTRSLAESEKFIIETIGMSGGKANEFTNSVLFRSKAEDISARMGDMTPDQEKAYKNVAGVKAVPTVRERMDALKANLGLKLRQGLVDQFAAIKQLDQNAYVQARMSKGTDGTLEAMLMYGKPFMRDGAPDVDVKDGGFAKVLASLKGEQDRWMMWIAAQRAEKLKAEGKENLMTDDDISALKTLNAGKMADGTARSPVYAKALQELNAYNDAMLKLAMDSGLIDQDAYDLMAGQPYVPFYRLMEDGDMKGPKFSSGLVNQKAWQKLKGGTQQLNADLLQNMLLNWSHLLQASAKNRAATATMDAAEKMAVAYKVSADTKGAVKVMRDGSAEHWMVEDPYLLDAISAIHYVPSPLMKPLAKFKQLLTWGVTVNPTFKIRNLIRDSVSAIAQADLGYNPAGNVAKGWKLTAKDSQIYASMLASGGLIKFGTQENTDRLRAQVAKLGGVVLDKSGTERFFGQIKDLYDVYNEFGDRAENVNRAALYDALIKKGKTHAEAAFMARDLMDFSMSGSAPVVRFLTQAVPFLNARLVGLDKLGRAAIEDPRRFAAVSGAVALASLALLAAYSDDDDWKKREDWDRDAYWWFKVGDQAYRIPKPFEVGAIGTLAERTAELMLSDEMTGKRYMERVSHMLSGTFSFNPVPQAFKPLLDLYANKDSFTGRAIESQADQRLRPQDRYSERTPEVAKFLGGLGLPDPAQLVKGEYSALSPKQVEHLIRGYFSWVGTAAMTVSDFGLRPLAGRGERPDMRLKDVFIAGNFVENLPTGSSRYVTQMYEQARQAEQAYASYQEAIKAGDTDKAQSIKESAGPLLRNRPAYTAATRQLAEINRMAKRIEADQAMAGAAKRARLTQLEQQRHVIAQRVSRLAAATP